MALISPDLKNSFSLVLYRPEIPANTGNIIRLAACLNVELHLIHPLGFSIDDKSLKRAGLDYHDLCCLTEHASLEEFLLKQNPKRMIGLTSKTDNSLWDYRFEKGDYLVFGQETKGLDAESRKACHDFVRIPMSQSARSLNLANAVAIVGYEAMRQLSFIF